MTSNIWLFLPILAVFAACEHDCQPCAQEDPCDFRDEQVAFSLGMSVPKALDLDGDGTITPEDRGAWINRCGTGE